MWLCFQDTVEIGLYRGEQLLIHVSVLHLLARLGQGFPDECSGDFRLAFFLIDQSQSVESVGNIWLREHKFLEDFFGIVKLAFINQVEPLIPPFDVFFFFEWFDVGVLFSNLFDIFVNIQRGVHMEKILKRGNFFKLLEMYDFKIAQAAKAGMCPYCGGKLNCGNYPRKSRGIMGWDKRHSFDCSRCRRRTTPPSVRFLGRRVYAGVVVVLIGAMMHGASAGRAQILAEKLKIDRRTVQRWLIWWREVFMESGFWKGARSRFMPPVDAARMPLGLVEAFGAERCGGMVNLLRFLAPITTNSCEMAVVM